MTFGCFPFSCYGVNLNYYHKKKIHSVDIDKDDERGKSLTINQNHAVEAL